MIIGITVRRVTLGLAVVAAATMAAPAALAHAAKHPTQPSSRLLAGQTLRPGHSLAAVHGPSRLTMRRDGNLVLLYLPLEQATPSARATKAPPKGCATRRCTFLRPRVLWSSKTRGHRGASFKVLENGNAIVARGSHVYWSTKTAGHPGISVKLLDSGKLVARAPRHKRRGRTASAADQQIYWRTTTGTPAFVGSTLTSGESVQGNEFLQSPNGQYEVDVSTSGAMLIWVMGSGPCPMYIAPNYVTVDTPQNALSAAHYDWSTDPVPGSALTMQSGGNLVLGPAGGSATWATGTSSSSGASATIQNDGNFVVYAADGTALWSSGTDRVRGALLCPGEIMANDQVLQTWSYQSSGGWELQFAQDSGKGAELDLDSGNGVVHIYRSKKAATNPYLSMQEDGNLVAYPTGVAATAATAEWASNTENNVGAWAAVEIVGGILGVFDPPDYNGSGGFTTQPLWVSGDSDAAQANSAEMGGDTMGSVPLG